MPELVGELLAKLGLSISNSISNPIAIWPRWERSFVYPKNDYPIDQCLIINVHQFLILIFICTIHVFPDATTDDCCQLSPSPSYPFLYVYLDHLWPVAIEAGRIGTASHIFSRLLSKSSIVFLYLFIANNTIIQRPLLSDNATIWKASIIVTYDGFPLIVFSLVSCSKS